MTLLERQKPIELHDDGMRIVNHGKTTSGAFPYICLENTQLVAHVVAIKKEREMIQRRNDRRWS